MSIFDSFICRSLKVIRLFHGYGRNRDKRRLATAGLLCILSIALLQACRKGQERFYPSLADATKSGEVTRGWLPDFLPKSSSKIHLLYDPSSPRTWCAFEFSPTDTQRLRGNLTSVEAIPARVRYIEDPHVSWWPTPLTSDLDYERLRREGFVTYVAMEPDIESRTFLLLFAIDWTNGRGFFYRTPHQ